MAEEIYNVQTAATYCGVSPAAIKYHLYTSGKLVPDYQLGRQLLFRQATLDLWNIRRKSYWKNAKVTRA